MFLRREREMKLHLDKGRLLSVRESEINITCVRGLLWVTWPGSGDVIVREGDELSVKTDGSLCITAFSDSYIQIRTRINTKHIPRAALRKIISAIKANIKTGADDSIFGGSVHEFAR